MNYFSRINKFCIPQVLMVLKSNQPKNNYVAAVVEYSPIIFDSPRKTILANVEQYETIINNASHYVSIRYVKTNLYVLNVRNSPAFALTRVLFARRLYS